MARGDADMNRNKWRLHVFALFISLYFIKWRAGVPYAWMLSMAAIMPTIYRRLIISSIARAYRYVSLRLFDAGENIRHAWASKALLSFHWLSGWHLKEAKTYKSPQPPSRRALFYEHSADETETGLAESRYHLTRIYRQEAMFQNCLLDK